MDGNAEAVWDMGIKMRPSPRVLGYVAFTGDGIMSNLGLRGAFLPT